MASRYVEKGVPFLRSQNVKPGRIDLSSLKYIDEEFHDQLRKSQLNAGDLVIVRTGEPGVAAVIPEDLGAVNCSDLVIARPSPDVNVHFLCYAINETARDFVRAHTVGAVQQHFNVASAKRLALRLPSRREQDSVAAVLGALDGKIAVNERIAATADELIQCLYGSALTEPGAREVPLFSALEITFGAPFASSEFNSEGTGRPLLRIRDLKTFQPKVWTTQRLDKELLVVPGDTVAGMDAEFRPTFWLGESALLNQRVLHVRSLIGGGDPLCREALRAPFALVESYKTGTTVAHLNKSDLATLVLEAPSAKAVAWFEAATKPLHERIVAIAAESRALAALRDTLLPQLMSGKLRVRDAERIVEDAV
ncbi:hypothetical protein ACIPQJ_17650 [Streptomyces sp. NPDC090082]|uniref:hypothetical protein n=1 Tax=unclassified Streptomyces TaxID=2593676 RepID=UPI0038235E6B